MIVLRVTLLQRMLKGGHTFKMAEKREWTDKEVVRIMDLWAEETIQFSLDNARTPKKKNIIVQDSTNASSGI